MELNALRFGRDRAGLHSDDSSFSLALGVSCASTDGAVGDDHHREDRHCLHHALPACSSVLGALAQMTALRARVAELRSANSVLARTVLKGA